MQSPVTPVRHVRPFLCRKVSKWGTPEEFPSLSETVEKEGTGAEIPYVFPTLRYRHASASLIPPRVLRQPNQLTAIAEGSSAAGQPQNALTTSPTLQPYPPQGYRSHLSLQTNLPDGPFMLDNGFATTEEGDRAFLSTRLERWVPM